METCTIIIGSIALLILSIYIMINTHICDNHHCTLFQLCINEPDEKKIIYILDNLLDDSLWVFGLIASLITTLLLFFILPIKVTLIYFMIVFILAYLIYFCIISFLYNHYAKPIKNQIKKYIIEHQKK